MVHRLARGLVEGDVRAHLTRGMHVPPHLEMGLGQLEAAYEKAGLAQGVHRKIQAALKDRKLEKKPTETLLERAVAAKVIDDAERQQVEEAERARALAIAVDSFPGKRARAKSA